MKKYSFILLVITTLAACQTTEKVSLSNQVVHVIDTVRSFDSTHVKVVERVSNDTVYRDSIIYRYFYNYISNRYDSLKVDTVKIVQEVQKPSGFAESVGKVLDKVITIVIILTVWLVGLFLFWIAKKYKP